MASWSDIGQIANVAQVTGIDAVRLIGLIVKAASSARMHKKNCRRFANHLKLVGNLLEKLNLSDHEMYPETREPLEQLQDALRRSYILVQSCQDRSYLYLLSMGWNIAYQFKKAQNEIDGYLRLIPLINLVDNARFRRRLECIERDQHEYTLDDEEEKIHDIILEPDPSQDKTAMLKKTLSSSYPNLGFVEALQKENEKLHMELQLSQANCDMNQCEMIRHLIDVTRAAAKTTSPDAKTSHTNGGPMHAPVSSNSDHLYRKDPKWPEEWHADLLGCCAEPYLCLKTCFYPCGTLAKIATVSNDRHVTSTEVCNELMAYSLILSCCCYTCCIRRRLRKLFNIEGGYVDDFLSHLMCCCCALVQELREVDIRGVSGNGMAATKPPDVQFMEPYQ